MILALKPKNQSLKCARQSATNPSEPYINRWLNRSLCFPVSVVGGCRWVDDVPAAAVGGPVRPGLSEMQAGSRLDVGPGSESGLPPAGVCPGGKLPVHRLAPLRPGRGFSADGPEVFVSRSDLSSSHAPAPGPRPTLTPVPCPKLKGVKITVVVQTFDYKKHTPHKVIHELVKDMLRGVCVHEKHVINLEDVDTEIRYVVIESLHPDSTSAGLITSKTSVEIIGVQTVRHYRSQQQEQNTVSLGGLEEVSMYSLWWHDWCSSAEWTMWHLHVFFTVF